MYTDNTAKAAGYSKVVYGDSSQFTGYVKRTLEPSCTLARPSPRSCDETGNCHHQAVQARRGA
jgi:hypothetical protein